MHSVILTIQHMRFLFRNIGIRFVFEVHWYPNNQKLYVRDDVKVRNEDLI